MKKKVLILCVSTSLLSVNAFAWTSLSQLLACNWVADVSVGPVWENGGETQTFYLTPEIEKTYVANKNYKTLVDGEIFLGVQQRLSDTIKGQLGLALAVTSNANLSGDVWDDADPQFDNYSYSYKVQHTHIAVKGKLFLDNDVRRFIPWISASIGVGFNHAYSFDDVPLIPEAVDHPQFSSNTQTSFTYTLGIGVQRILTPNWQIGVGYEFADWGKSHLGRASGQTQNDGLELNHLYTNGVMFNLSYNA